MASTVYVPANSRTSARIFGRPPGLPDGLFESVACWLISCCSELFANSTVRPVRSPYSHRARATRAAGLARDVLLERLLKPPGASGVLRHRVRRDEPEDDRLLRGAQLGDTIGREL
jgi:hypothetical protein